MRKGSRSGGSTRAKSKNKEIPERGGVKWFDLDLSDKSNFRFAAINAFGLNQKPCGKSNTRTHTHKRIQMTNTQTHRLYNLCSFLFFFVHK